MKKIVLLAGFIALLGVQGCTKEQVIETVKSYAATHAAEEAPVINESATLVADCNGAQFDVSGYANTDEISLGLFGQPPYSLHPSAGEYHTYIPIDPSFQALGMPYQASFYIHRDGVKIFDYTTLIQCSVYE